MLQKIPGGSRQFSGMNGSSAESAEVLGQGLPRPHTRDGALNQGAQPASEAFRGRSGLNYAAGKGRERPHPALQVVCRRDVVTKPRRGVTGPGENPGEYGIGAKVHIKRIREPKWRGAPCTYRRHDPLKKDERATLAPHSGGFASRCGAAH